MKRRIQLIAIFIISSLQFQTSSAQIFCKPNGNVVIYSNYDGGYLNINVDQNIPNLKIGITTYEDCEVTISGTYASNVTEVIYAGYQGDNQHCNPSPLTTTVNGVNANIVTILQFPPVTWNNPYGYPYLICNYNCDSSAYNGGCNTPDQIAHYYLTDFGGSLYYHYTQYGCWVGTYNLSSGGNCCIGEDLIPSQFSLFADFTASEDTICAEQGIFFTNNSFNSYPGAPEYNWDFGDGSPNLTTEDASHGFTIPGNYTVTLTITDSSGVATDTQTIVITVLDCGPTGIDKTDPVNQVSVQPNPASELLNFKFTEHTLFPVSLEIVDATGRTRMVKELKSGSLPDGKVTWDIQELPAGLYLIRIRGTNHLEEMKLMIE